MTRRDAVVTWTAFLLKKGFTETNAVRETLLKEVRHYEVVAGQLSRSTRGLKRFGYKVEVQWVVHVRA